ncbi:MAG: hypothetical protein JWO46_2574 [Nocardioidaceae bacterium]|nr:hypothetical protein [Nocardioidaceae bacterium]
MAPELRDLLDRSVEHPPREPYDVGTIVHRARRSRRRHRTLAVAGSVLGVVAVVGLVVGVVNTRPAGPPVADNAVVGPVAHLTDAVRGVDGRDYALVSTYVNTDLDAGNGRLFPAVTSSGAVLVSQATLRVPDERMSEITQYGVLSPATGETAWLPAPPDATYSNDHAPSGPDVVALTDDTAVWVDSSDEKTWKVDLYARAAGTWSSFAIPVGSLPHADEPMFPDHVRLADNRLWFTLEAGPRTQRLWSMPADGSSPPRTEGRVGDWDIAGSTLVSTDVTNAPASRMTVRDLGTGTSRSFDPRSGDRCNQLGLTVARGRVALAEYCGTRHKVRDDRVQVLTTSGDPVITIQGDGVELGGLGSAFVSVDANAGKPGDGSYVYDLDRARLVRLSTGVGSFDGVAGAGGSTLTWGTPVNDRRGTKLWAATWQ